MVGIMVNLLFGLGNLTQEHVKERVFGIPQVVVGLMVTEK